MAVKLRLRREGTVKRPHYRIVAADSRSPRDGRFIETIGNYHPLDQPSTINVDNERALHWLRNGALPTSAVEKLLRISGAWEEFKPGDAPARVRTDRTKGLSKKARARAEVAAAAAAAPPAPVEEPVAEAPVEDEAPATEAPAAEAPAAETPAEDEA
jgi:small subunit ribosomal protein S16